MGEFKGQAETLDLPRADLDGWIAVATEGLCERAKAQIDSQVQAEFAEDYQRHIEAGLSSPRAFNRAIVNLGEPKDALKEFEKLYFTKQEAKIADRFRNLRWWRLGFQFLFPFPIVFGSIPLACIASQSVSLGTISRGFVVIAGYLVLLVMAAHHGRSYAIQGKLKTAFLGHFAMLLLVTVWTATGSFMLASPAWTKYPTLTEGPGLSVPFVFPVLIVIQSAGALFHPGVGYAYIIMKLRRQRVRANDAADMLS